MSAIGPEDSAADRSDAIQIRTRLPFLYSAFPFNSVAEAAEILRKILATPMSVTVQTINLTQLGDEAYMSPNGPYAKEGQTDPFFRKGNFVIIMSASKPDIAPTFREAHCKRDQKLNKLPHLINVFARRLVCDAV